MQIILPIAIALLTVMGAGIFAPSVTSAANISDSISITAEKCFREAPSEVLQLITPNTRLDMIDYFEAGMQRASSNAAGGECAMLQVEPKSVTLKAGEGIRYQFFVLDGSKQSYIGVIETLETPCEESAVKFYTADWTPIDAHKTGFFREPTLKDWMLENDKRTLAEARKTLPFIFTSYTYDPAAGTLTATNTMDGYYHPTDTPAILSDIRPSITYKWDSKRNAFVMSKK